jgi:hypothetical protein
MSEEGEVTGEAPNVVTGVEVAAQVNPQTAVQADWHWSNQDGAEVKGIGSRPEWLKEKYKSAEDQAKAYLDAEKRLGKFTGAPDTYDVDKYAEDRLFSHDSEKFQQFSSMAKEMGVNQEGFNQLMDFYTKDRNEIIESLRYSEDRERSALGDDADHRIDNANRFLRATLDVDEYEAAVSKLTTHESIELVEMMMKATSPKKLPSQGGNNPNGITKESLDSMRYTKNENGSYRMSTDPEYAARYNKMAEEFYGTDAAVEVVRF